jgi:hypothetical protein
MEAAGIEPASRRKQNPKQVALLPTNALISHRIVLPPSPVSSRLVPPRSVLESHTGGTGRPFIGSRGPRRRSDFIVGQERAE